MIAIRAAETPLDRLGGDGKRGGGLPLSTLFGKLLDRLYAEQSLSPKTATEAVRVWVRNQLPRMAELYGMAPPDALEACVRDAMEVLVEQGLAVRDGAGWVPGPDLKPGVWLVVYPEREGRPHSEVKHMVFSEEERQRLDAEARARAGVVTMARDIRNGGDGLRPVDPRRVAAIIESVERFGKYDALFPIVEDQEGRILSGRHRSVAAQRMGKPWKRLTVKRSLSDQEALAISWVGNDQEPWSGNDVNRLKREIGAHPAEAIAGEFQRYQIVQHLVHHTRWSNAKIARALNVDPTEVLRVRAPLEEAGTITKTIPGKGGRGHTERALAPPPTEVDSTEPDRSKPRQCLGLDQITQEAPGSPPPAPTEATSARASVSIQDAPPECVTAVTADSKAAKNEAEAEQAKPEPQPEPVLPEWWPMRRGQPYRPPINPKNPKATVDLWIAQGIYCEYGEDFAAAINAAISEGRWPRWRR